MKPRSAPHFLVERQLSRRWHVRYEGADGHRCVIAALQQKYSGLWRRAGPPSKAATGHAHVLWLLRVETSLAAFPAMI